MSMRKERKSLVLDIVGFQELGPIFESQIYCLHKYLLEYNQMREVQRNLTFRFYGKNKRSNDAGTMDNIKLDSIGIHFHIKQFSIANFDLFSNLYFEVQRKNIAIKCET